MVDIYFEDQLPVLLPSRCVCLLLQSVSRCGRELSNGM
uniref:Uncharacterized protein n=1 Tax=Anguilla anguilla TaxID=7936 RepID=A0A0E9V469_ANGAN